MNTIKTTKTYEIDRCIEAAVLVLMATGTVFVFSAGANLKTEFSLKHFYSFTVLKQLLFFPLAVAIMYAVSQIDYRNFSLKNGIFRSLTPYLAAISLILLILVLIPGIGIGIGPDRSFARRWLDIAPGALYISFQPSELAKWSVVFALAAFLDAFADKMRYYLKGFIPACMIAAIPAVLIITQDFGTAAFIVGICFVMLVIGPSVWWHFLTPLPVLVPAFYFSVVSSPTRLNRILAFFRPDAANTAVYQAKQSLIAISTGGLWGKGLAKGISKYGHLPEDTTDFIFAIIAEEMGFAGAAMVIAVFIIFVILAIVVVSRCDDPFGKMLAGGITIAIAAQAAINIAVVTVVVPTKGISLPFISAGGTGMLLSAAAVGILLNIARQAGKEPACPAA